MDEWIEKVRDSESHINIISFPANKDQIIYYIVCYMYVYILLHPPRQQVTSMYGDSQSMYSKLSLESLSSNW